MITCIIMENWSSLLTGMRNNVFWDSNKKAYRNWRALNVLFSVIDSGSYRKP